MGLVALPSTKAQCSVHPFTAPEAPHPREGGSLRGCCPPHFRAGCCQPLQSTLGLQCSSIGGEGKDFEPRLSKRAALLLANST